VDKLICTLWITLITPSGPEPTKVEIPVTVLEVSDIRYKVDASKAMKRFPNRDKEVDFKKLTVWKTQCQS
jgi:hypothetical protein